jgi:hypothetical protein
MPDPVEGIADGSLDKSVDFIHISSNVTDVSTDGDREELSQESGGRA